MDVDKFICSTAAGRNQMLRDDRNATGRKGMSDTQKVLVLKQEGQKSVTVNAHGGDVALIFWRKSGAPLLPLSLTYMEAKTLLSMLGKALDDAAIVRGS